LNGCLAPEVNRSVISNVGPVASSSLEGTTGESEEGPIAVEKVRDTGTAAVSGIGGGANGGGWVDCSRAVVVSVLAGPAGLSSEGRCWAEEEASRFDISTGVGLGASSAVRSLACCD
jgi:hypothetical protein